MTKKQKVPVPRAAITYKLVTDRHGWVSVEPETPAEYPAKDWMLEVERRSQPPARRIV
jgi:hypothetical protein